MMSLGTFEKFEREVMKRAGFSERQILERFIDNYNWAEKSILFNFFPKLLNKKELLEKYDKKA